MRRIMSTVIASLILAVSIIAGASSAQAASVYVGPYSSFAQCQQIQGSYQQYGHKTILKACYYANSPQVGWFFTYYTP